MPSPTTALQIIIDALDLTNAVGSDQTLTTDEVSKSLRAFNDLIEIFNTRNLAVYGAVNQTFNTIANQFVYTIGSGGDWSTTRPERINSPAYSVTNGVTSACTSMTQGEYNLIAYKAQTLPWPERYLYVNTFPLGTVTLFPVPSAVVPVTFSIDNQITAISSAGASISFPPGYAMVFKYKLAVMLGDSFGVNIKDFPDVVSTATETFADICRANKKLRVMSFDPALGGTGGGGSALGRFLGGN
jgi:hypothetical protein